MKSNLENRTNTDLALNFLFSFLQVCDNFKEMVPNNIRSMRMSKEISQLATNPPHGITCWAKNDRNDLLEASKITKQINAPFFIKSLFMNSCTRQQRNTL